ncbi:methyl-accepting chemotaxis protein [Pseudophaeobacter sp.]|uniref:methyl-accepting chemotaxis protein n=1 Tax=Pseudophaeobacter sp. TaxID=1971739 RepID=UPI0032984EBA
MSLRSQILALLALPFIALAAVGGIKGLTDWGLYQSAQKTQNDTFHSLKLNNLIHYLQVERGQSSAFISSGGTIFVSELNETRGRVDLAMSEVTEAVQSLLSGVSNLDAIRSSVTDLTVTAPEAGAAYTKAIGGILSGVGQRLILQDNPQIAQIGSGLVALLSAKEAAGQQRAAGAGGLGKGAFPLPVFLKFAETGGNETRLLEVAELALRSHFPDLDLRKGLVETDLPEMRKAILAAGPEGKTPDFSAQEWFRNASAWLTYLHEVEGEIASNMDNLAKDAASKAWMALVVTSVGVLLALLVSATIGARLILSFTKQFGSLQRDLDRISRKEFDFTPENLDQDTEVGRLSQAMEVTRAALQEAEEKLVAIEKNRVSDRGAVVGKLDTHLGRLAERDLDCEITEAFPEEYEEVRASFNATVATLKSTMLQVISATGSIHNGAAEISQAADDLSNRTESQAATLEETAAALEEMTASVKSAAEGARSVEATMGEARQEAEKSGVVVREAVSAMTEIENSSVQISQIISVIDDIAFQTNLLALNAGVEAARAGEAGRGFAVVASEVRGLAQRSADAATEIKTLISDSSKQVEQGVGLVGKAGEALNSIVGRVNEISNLVSGIAAGTSEQATGLSEINTGMTQLDQVTQQNAAMVEETTAAGHLLHSDAGKLATLMQEFTLADAPKIVVKNAASLPEADEPNTEDWATTEPASHPVALEGNASWQDF